MNVALVVAVESNYVKGLTKFTNSWLDHCSRGFTMYIISRTIHGANTIIPHTPVGKTGMPWLTDSFTWFEALKLNEDLIIVADADQLVVGDVDDLWSLEPGIYASKVKGDGRYCTGLVVFSQIQRERRLMMYEDMTAMITTETWRYGDESLFNRYFSDVKELDSTWQHLKCYGMQGVEQARIIHYHGQPKPWEATETSNELVKIWMSYDAAI